MAWDPREQEFRIEEVKWEGGKEVQGRDGALAVATGHRGSLLPETFYEMLLELCLSAEGGSILPGALVPPRCGSHAHNCRWAAGEVPRQN